MDDREPITRAARVRIPDIQYKSLIIFGGMGGEGGGAQRSVFRDFESKKTGARSAAKPTTVVKEWPSPKQCIKKILV